MKTKAEMEVIIDSMVKEFVNQWIEIELFLASNGDKIGNADYNNFLKTQYRIEYEIKQATGKDFATIKAMGD